MSSKKNFFSTFFRISFFWKTKKLFVGGQKSSPEFFWNLKLTDLSSTTLNPAPELQGIGTQTKALKQATLTNNQSSAATIKEYPALAGKGLSIKYKIVRGTTDRTGELIISASTNGVSYDDTYTESGADVGVTLSAVLDNKDSTGGNETVALQYITTNTGSAATLEYKTTILV